MVDISDRVKKLVYIDTFAFLGMGSTIYEGPLHEFAQSYARPFSASVCLYMFGTLTNSRISARPLYNTLFVTAAGCIHELMEFANICPEIHDFPGDYISYTAGAIVAYCLERLTLSD